MDYFDNSSLSSSLSSAGVDGFVTTPLSENVSASKMPGAVGSVPYGQMPTPPPSEASPFENESCKEFTISVSTAFYPGASVDALPSDLILASSDAVLFYVHSHRLLSSSWNKFDGHLPLRQGQGYSAEQDNDSHAILGLPEPSAVVNIVLHTIYHLPFAQYSPTTQHLVAAVDALAKYGMVLKEYIAPSTPLFQQLSLHAPLNPIEMYILAASHDLHELAVVTSSHLLSFPLSTITDDMAVRMGPVYLKRLVFLHLGRVEALKRILAPPPQPHPPTMTCNFAEQKEVLRVWALAAAYLAWDARPDLPISTIKHTLNPLIEKLPCDTCKQALQDRIRNMLAQWSMVKNTI